MELTDSGYPPCIRPNRLRRCLPPLGLPLPLPRRLSAAPTATPAEPITAVAALSLLRSEKDPARVLSICRAAALSPNSHPDRTALSLAVSSLSAAGSPTSVRSLLDGLLSSTSAAVARPHVIVLFGQAGMLPDALRTFEASQTPSVRSLNALLFACILSKKHAEVPRIFYDFTISYGFSI
ncbi:Pentatricopeptide repeat-containing protein [Musa troglodytarum]|uniref:Pentatricopeptide repeat-containing protein n=1 Tax=Musa troglodytarum TaxID=320322 RepID=A0A9E7ERG8_9LILI|nr:Pentatricopeptide repeat-containing protein [Musa troglodytarum]